LGRFVSGAAVVAAEEEDSAEAVARLRGGFAIPRHFQSCDPELFTSLLGVVSDSMMLDAAEDVLRRCDLDEREARRLAEELPRIDYHGWTIRGIEAHRAKGLALFDGVSRGNVRREDWWMQRRPLPSEEARWYAHARALPALFEADKLYFLRRSADVDRQAAVPYRLRNSMATGSYRIRQPTRAPSWALVSGWALKPLVPSPEPEIVMAGRALLAAALGLEVCRQTEGHYPSHLADLEAVDWPVMDDIFSGEELCYRLDGGHYVLYSVGPNLTDDGGNAAPWVSELYTPHLDIVWGETRFWH
jgi:hypothetical protein